MPTETHRRLVEYIGDEAGDSVRWIGRYEGDSLDLLFDRGDFDRLAFKRRVALTTELARTKYDLVDEDRPEPQTRTHVELFEAVAVVHLREGPDRAVLFAVDVPPVGELTSFVDGCRTVIEMTSADWDG